MGVAKLLAVRKVPRVGIELKPQSGPSFTLPLSPIMAVDLLAEQGTDRATLLDGVEVPAGRYNWLRLSVIAEQGVVDSYIVFSGATDVDIVAGEETVHDF